MGFGYKTSWLAVRHASPEQVADALGLRHRVAADWTSGTAAAYEHGVFVARPHPEWTIAHSRPHLPPYLDASTAEFPQRLLSLGRALGDLQFFATDRIGDYHAWARVDGGELTRAYCYVGDHGDVPLHLGERTGVEVELGVGDRWLEDGWESWDESEWDAWHDSMPNEEDVLRVARSWGMSPVDIAEDSVTAPGILGLPPGISPRKGARERT